MTTLRGEQLMWVSAVTLAALGVGGSRPAPEEVPQTAPPLVQLDRAPAGDSLQIWGKRVVRGNPFRLSRRPPTIRFGQEPSTPIAPVEAPTLQLVLLGVTGGPPWQAVVSGFSGERTPKVVRAGERVGGFFVLAISRDSVVLSGPDSTLRVGLLAP